MIAEPTPNQEQVLGQAVLETAKFLNLSDEHLGKIIGRDRSSIARLKKSPNLSPASKNGELALILIRIYRGLFAILGGNQGAMIGWLNDHNEALGETPSEAMKTVPGLINTLEYVDAMRGKV